MELIDNINKTLKGDFVTELRSGSKVAIAALCFSIYAFEELKRFLGYLYLNAFLERRTPDSESF